MAQLQTYSLSASSGSTDGQRALGAVLLPGGQSRTSTVAAGRQLQNADASYCQKRNTYSTT